MAIDPKISSRMFTLERSDSSRQRTVSLRGLGNRRLLEEAGVGICGSRDVSSTGMEIATIVGASAARAGITLVAGDARGVDEVAETAALRSGGNVIAVLAEGFASWRPRKAYQEWIDEDMSNFLAVSEFDDQARWQAFRAMARNKTVVGLSSLVLVIEARLKGGTYDAGLSALAAGRVLCVLGHDRGSLSDGSIDLLRRGGLYVSSEEIQPMLLALADGVLPASGQQSRLAI